VDDSRKASSVPGKMMKMMVKMVHNTSVQGQFTHHQKTVMCDAPSAVRPDKRHVVAFVGGLDLTDGCVLSGLESYLGLMLRPVAQILRTRIPKRRFDWWVMKDFFLKSLP
jgi:hypothetical protein